MSGADVGSTKYKCGASSNADSAGTAVTSQKAKITGPLQRPGVGCAVFVLSDKHPRQFLLGVRKGNGPDAGLSQLCGGHQEFGETWEQTAYRETLEEAGVRLCNISFVGVVNSIRREIGYHFITIFMKGYIDYSQGDQEVCAMEPDKCDSWKWTTLEELPSKEQLFFALADFIAQGLSPFSSDQTR